MARAKQPDSRLKEIVREQLERENEALAASLPPEEILEKLELSSAFTSRFEHIVIGGLEVRKAHRRKLAMRVATIIVAFVFLLAVILPAPPVRAALRTMSVYMGLGSYTLSSIDTSQYTVGEFFFAYLPDGYHISDVNLEVEAIYVTITAPEKEPIFFSLKSLAGAKPGVDADYTGLQLGYINDYEAYFFESLVDYRPNQIIWIVENQMLSIESLIPLSDLKLIAKHCRKM